MIRIDKTVWSCGFAIVGSWALLFAAMEAGQLFERLFGKTYPNGFYGAPLPHMLFALWLSMRPTALFVFAGVGTVTLLAMQRWLTNAETRMLIHCSYLTAWACFTTLAIALLLAVPL